MSLAPYAYLQRLNDFASIRSPASDKNQLLNKKGALQASAGRLDVLLIQWKLPSPIVVFDNLMGGSLKPKVCDV